MNKNLVFLKIDWIKFYFLALNGNHCCNNKVIKAT